MEQFKQTHQARINQVLDRLLPPASQQPTDLHRAMRYGVEGGKRLRAMLVYASGQAFNADLDDLDVAAAAVELIHAYSLIHDDLPAMDDDDLRRGKPTCHKAFGEGTAVLAGDALQSLAFEILANNFKNVGAEQSLIIIATLAKNIGSAGMAGGQALDLAAEGKVVDQAQLMQIHQLKTAALIAASVVIGALVGGCNDDQQLGQLKLFGQKIGLAFQIRDDILDIESSTEMLGKTQGADIASQKATYPSIMGLSSAKQRADQVYTEALQHLQTAAIDTSLFAQLAEFVIKRSY